MFSLLIAHVIHNDLMRKKHKKTCKHLNQVENFLILVSATTDCVSISAFTSSVAVPGGIRISAVELEILGTTAGLKRISQLSKKKNEKKRSMIK